MAACGTCGLHYRTPEDEARGVRCRCWNHCPCAGACDGTSECACKKTKQIVLVPTCLACRRAPEARPGVRLCRSCLEVAGVALEAIRAEETQECARRSGANS